MKEKLNCIGVNEKRHKSGDMTFSLLNFAGKSRREAARTHLTTLRNLHVCWFVTCPYHSRPFSYTHTVII